MKKLLLILILQIIAGGKAQCQSFTIDDLLKLANLPLHNIDIYMKKKGFRLSENIPDSSSMTAEFTSIAKSKNYVDKKSITVSIKNSEKRFTLHTYALNEFEEGERKLIKSGFFYDSVQYLARKAPLLFQKANVTVKTDSLIEDGITQYSIELKVSAVPSSVMNAEDLLQFTSHRFLVSFFGDENVKKDIYYLTEKELKKCSVLFSGTRRQVVFVWNDETYLNDLAYIIVTNSLPTEGAKNADPLPGNNQWKLKNGICPGMTIKDLLTINEMDFDIYGNKSELSFLVKPNEYGKIDFKKTAVMLTCHECFDNKIFNQSLVSALSIAKANLPMRIFDVVIYPSSQ